MNLLRDGHLGIHLNIEREYQEFCECHLSAAKQCIPHGRRKNYVPCWDKECETVYLSFTRAPLGTESDRAASSLLSCREHRKQERWVETFNSIDFSHSSPKGWRTINKLLADLDARESTRLVNKELSDLWKIPTPEGHSIYEPLGRRSLLLPTDAWSQESLGDWIPSSRSLYSRPGRLSNLGFATSSLPACTNSKL